MNLFYESRNLRNGYSAVRAAARRGPFGGKQFDIAFSNSLIERMGTWENQPKLASEIRRMAASYYVKMPNKWFPIEAHYLTPLAQFVPRRIKPWVLRWLTVWGWMMKPSMRDCAAASSEVRLLDAHEMRALFPDCTFIRERFLGSTKSIIAFKSRSCGDGEESGLGAVPCGAGLFEILGDKRHQL